MKKIILLGVLLAIPLKAQAPTSYAPKRLADVTLKGNKIHVLKMNDNGCEIYILANGVDGKAVSMALGRGCK